MPMLRDAIGHLVAERKNGTAIKLDIGGKLSQT
jgi:hypothetical protein